MQLTSENLTQLAQLAINAAKKAGALIQSYTGKNIDIKNKVGGESLASQVVTEVDVKSQDIILDTLKPSMAKYDLALLSEESEDDKSRFVKDYFWCIDPLDGTLPFTEGTPGYSVAIALVAKNGEPQIGVIYNPVNNTLYHAINGLGAFKNLDPFKIQEQNKQNKLGVFINRSFLSDTHYHTVMDSFEEIAKSLGLEGINITSHGGAAMNSCWVLEKHPACYFKFPQIKNGGGSLWDFAATACIFNEAMAPATDSYGQTLDLNRADSTFMNHKGILYASDKTIAKRVVDLYKKIKKD